MPHLIGGALCLDFVNTVDPRHAPERREYLDSYPALVAWGSHAGDIDASLEERLSAAAAAQPAAADTGLGPRRPSLPRQTGWWAERSGCGRLSIPCSASRNTDGNPNMRISACCRPR